MRVLIAGLSSATAPSGICRTIASLVRGLKEADPTIEVELAIGSWQRAYFENAFALGAVSLHVVDTKNSTTARNLWYLFGLPRLARILNADVVHLSFPAPLVRRAFEAAVVSTVHDLYQYDCPENFGFPKVLGNRLALRRALAASDRVACVSQGTLQSLRERFPRFVKEKTVLIENATSVAPPGESTRCSIGYPFLLAVAQHRANKRLDVLLRAFHRYRSESDQRQLRLVIVGAPGPETPALLALMRELAIERQVALYSNLADGELAQLYRSCELFINQSSLEGYGLALGEAISSGARALASDIPAHRAVGGEQCRYVAVGGEDEPQRIAAAIRVSLSSPKPLLPNRLPTPAETAAQYLSLYADASSARSVPVRDCAMASSSWELR